MYTISRLLLAVAFLCWGVTMLAQPAEEWSGSYGGDGFEEAKRLVLAPEGGFYIIGHTSSPRSGRLVNDGFGSVDLLVVKVAADSTIVWERRFGGDNQDSPRDAILDSQGRLVIVGFTLSDVSGNKDSGIFGTPSLTFEDAWVVCVDRDGNKLWDTTYGGFGSEVGFGIVELDNGNFMVTGRSDSNGDQATTRRIPRIGSADYWLFEIDTDGVFLNEWLYGGAGPENFWGQASLKLVDGTILISGTSSSGADGAKSLPSNGSSDYYLIRVNQQGQLLNEYVFGGDQGENPLFTTQFTNGDIFVSGQSVSGISGNKASPAYGGLDLWCIRFDLNTGNIVWEETFGGAQDDNAYTGRKNINDYILLAGNTKSAQRNGIVDTLDGGDDGWLKYISPDGEAIWDISRGGNRSDNIRNIIRSEDGGWYLIGESNSDAFDWKNGISLGTDFNGVRSNDIWYAKLECDFNVDLGVRDTALCIGEELLLQNENSRKVLPHTSHLWSNGTTDTVLTITASIDEEIILQSVSPDACEAIDTVSVTVHANPTLDDLTVTDESCAGLNNGSIYFEASMDALNFVFNGTAYTAPQLFDELTAGDYNLRVNSTLDRCGFDTTISLVPESAFSIDLGADRELVIGDFVTLDANPSTTDSLTYTWSGLPGLCANCASQSIRLMQSGIVVVTATNEQGCTEEARVVLNGLEDKRVGIPNAISPNNDGINDRFAVFATPFVEKMGPMRVFDRWGNMLYVGIGEQLSITDGWDGTMNGKPVQEGVYTYILPVVFIDGEERIFQGEVHLIR